MLNTANWAAAAAFVLGIAGVQLYADRLRAELQGGEPLSVLVVTQDLPSGALLTEEHLASIHIPSDYVDGRRVLTADQKALLGAQLRSELSAGDPLFWSDLADGEAHRDLAQLVAPGRRAYQVEADANPLGSMLHAGDHVDVLLERGGSTELLLERVLVLAVGGRLRTDEGEPSGRASHGVTLSVTVDQGAELLGAEARGDLRLLLRNPEDLVAGDRAGGPSPPAAPQAEAQSSAPPKKEIEHVR